MSASDILKNLPLFIFILVFFIVFVRFISGGFVLLFAKENIYKIEKGRRTLLNSLYGLFVILLISFVFFSVTYLLKRGEVLRPSETPGEFPSSPVINFPPPPQFIKIGKYYFPGPWLLKGKDIIKSPAVYSILCKKNEEYDIMYIGETAGVTRLLEHNQYKCWLKNCDQKLKNLYLAILLTPSGKYSSDQVEAIGNELRGEIKPPCPPPNI